MQAFPIILIYLTLFVLTLNVVRRMRFDRLSYLDGILVGTLYFLAGPLALALFSGEMPAGLLRIEAFRPYEDLTVTYSLFAGWLTVIAANFFADRFIRPPEKSRIQFEGKHLALAFVLYLFCSISAFFLVGKHLAGHWMENASLAYSRDFRAIFISNAANIMRGAVFGMLIYAAERKLMTRRAALLLGGLVVMMDLAITFNRITAAYFAIMAFIVYRRRIWLLLLLLITATPALGYLSAMWSVARAQLLNGGLSASSVRSGLIIGNQISQAQHQTLYDRFNNLFEADNIVVFSFIVKSIPATLEPLWGSTYIVRTFAVVVPNTIWHDKPVTFGNVIGGHMQGLSELTLNSTLFGEPYGNFYFLWLPAMFLMLLLMQFIFQFAARFSAAAGCFAFFAGFAAWRFENSGSMIAVVILIVFVALQATMEFRNIVSKGTLRRAAFR